jgi:hypothetical protein
VANDKLRTFMDRPLDFFEGSLTKMYGIQRDELEELQGRAMIERFAEHREQIEMVRKLADRLGVASVDKFDDIVPLMFSHTAYKSYPPALLDNKRWDLMTRWLDKLTAYDLSRVDVEGVDTIDEWLDRLEAQTPVQLVTSTRDHSKNNCATGFRCSAPNGSPRWAMRPASTSPSRRTRWSPCAGCASGSSTSVANPRGPCPCGRCPCDAAFVLRHQDEHDASDE